MTRAAPGGSGSLPRVVALTGGSGFIGRHLIAALDAAGCRLRVLLRQPERLALPAGAVAIGGDLAADEALAELTAGTDVVIHAAGAVRGASRADFMRVNRDGTSRLLTHCRRAGAPDFIFLSSLAAREPALSAYAASKAAAEHLLVNGDYPGAWQIVRPPAVYGPGDRELLPLFALWRRGFGVRPGVPNGRLSLLHVMDLARLCVALTRTPPKSTLCEPDDGSGGYSWEELLAIAAEAFARRIRPLVVPRAAATVAAGFNLAWARLGRRPPMLTPGKLNELWHNDWVVRRQPPADLWQPSIGLAAGLATLYQTGRTATGPRQEPESR